MKDNQAKYPQLRFKGFTDPWDKRYLGDYVVDYTEKTTQENQFPVLTSSQQQGIVLQSEYFSDRQVTTDENIGYFVLPRGYFTYRSRSDNNIFVFNRNDIIDKGIISYFYPVFGLINADSNFFLRRINNGLNRQLAIAAEGTGQHVLSLKKFKKMETRFPSLPEQKQIGEFLECLDDLITVNQRKLAKLKELKQGYLQKMFPQNGSKFPQLRFAGFADAWEQRKLGEEAQLTMGQSPNSENYTKNPDDYILVQGNADMKNGRVVPRVWTTQITKKAEKSDLILSVRAPVGDIGKTDYDVVLGRGVAAIKGNEFIFQQLGKMKLTGYWTRYSTGSTFESINSNDIKDAKIMVPVEEEQQKIGAFFKQLDDTIVLHQRKLEKLQELKKGYLQKMFC